MGKVVADVITLHDEPVPGSDGEAYAIFDPKAPWKRKKITDFQVKDLREKIFDNGKLVYKSPDIEEIRRYCAEQVATLWDEMYRFEKPQTYYVDLSQKLYDLKTTLIEEHMEK